jgi:hypothetical protein
MRMVQHGLCICTCVLAHNGRWAHAHLHLRIQNPGQTARMFSWLLAGGDERMKMKMKINDKNTTTTTTARLSQLA